MSKSTMFTLFLYQSTTQLVYEKNYSLANIKIKETSQFTNQFILECTLAVGYVCLDFR